MEKPEIPAAGPGDAGYQWRIRRLRKVPPRAAFKRARLEAIRIQAGCRDGHLRIHVQCYSTVGYLHVSSRRQVGRLALGLSLRVPTSSHANCSLARKARSRAARSHANVSCPRLVESKAHRHWGARLADSQKSADGKLGTAREHGASHPESGDRASVQSFAHWCFTN